MKVPNNCNSNLDCEEDNEKRCCPGPCDTESCKGKLLFLKFFFQSKLKSIFIFKYSSFGGRIHNGTVINDYFKFSMSILDTK